MKIFVHDAGLGKSLMIAFESTDQTETYILNHCIREVMDEHQLRAFHQIGVNHHGTDEPGFHAWESWAAHKVTVEELESLIPLIQERVHLMWEIW